MTITLVATALALAAGLSFVRVVGADQCLVVRRSGRVVRTTGPGLGYVVPLLESAHLTDIGPRHGWATTTATTSDGVAARLHVEFTIRITDPGSVPLNVEGHVVDAVENRLRHLVTGSALWELPEAGDDPGWPGDSFLTGVRVEHVAVSFADVSVGAELRRLVAHRDAWT